MIRPCLAARQKTVLSETLLLPSRRSRAGIGNIIKPRSASSGYHRPPGTPLVARMGADDPKRLCDGQCRRAPGDIVLDCGPCRHVHACSASKRRGAVIAIEPAQANIVAFQANFVDELASGRVKLVKAGVWTNATQSRSEAETIPRATVSSPSGVERFSSTFLFCRLTIWWTNCIFPESISSRWILRARSAMPLPARAEPFRAFRPGW